MRAGKFHARNGAKSLLAGKCDLALENNAIADAGADAGLNEAGHATGNFRFELNRFTGHDGAENLDRTEGGEFQIAQGFAGGIALGDNAGELSARFGDENSWHERRAWKMAGQKMFVAAQFVFAATLFAGIKFDNAI